jgi:hypothetical protein
MPASGSTLSIGSCGRGACTHALAYSFVVRLDAPIQQPVFRVALTTAEGVECLAAYETDLVPLRAGEPHGFAGDTLLFSTTPQGSQPEDNNCKPPFTTTRIETELRDGSVTQPVLLAQDFDVTYQWRQ